MLKTNHYVEATCVEKPESLATMTLLDYSEEEAQASWRVLAWDPTDAAHRIWRQHEEILDLAQTIAVSPWTDIGNSTFYRYDEATDTLHVDPD